MTGLKYHPMKLVTESLGYRNLLVFKFETSYINLTTCSVILIIELCTREAAEKDFLRDLLLLYLFNNVFKRPNGCIHRDSARNKQIDLNIRYLF